MHRNNRILPIGMLLIALAIMYPLTRARAAGPFTARSAWDHTTVALTSQPTSQERMEDAIDQLDELYINLLKGYDVVLAKLKARATALDQEGRDVEAVYREILAADDALETATDQLNDVISTLDALAMQPSRKPAQIRQLRVSAKQAVQDVERAFGRAVEQLKAVTR